MKTAGIIGGMSWESTAKYYQWLNEGIRAKLGGLHSAPLVLTSVDFDPVAKLQAADHWDEAGEQLAREAARLERAGADFILLATNTMHRVAAQIEAAASIPFIHLADATAERITASGLGKVGLLGTIYTMEQDFYKGRLAAHGLEVVVPEAGTRREINRIIFQELCLGRIDPASRGVFLRAAAEMTSAGAQGVILGCTEITLLVGPDDFAVPAFDTTRIHIETALELMLA